MTSEGRGSGVRGDCEVHVRGGLGRSLPVCDITITLRSNLNKQRGGRGADSAAVPGRPKWESRCSGPRVHMKMCAGRRVVERGVKVATKKS